MEKKIILVGHRSMSTAFRFMNIVADSLTRKSVDIVYIDHKALCFETRHTKVQYVVGSDGMKLIEGVQADAIFGEEWPGLLAHAKPNAILASKSYIGLNEYICKIEQGAIEGDVDSLYPQTIFANGRSGGKTQACIEHITNMVVKGDVTVKDIEQMLYVRNDIRGAQMLASAMRELDTKLFSRKIPAIEKVHFSGPVTAVIWHDGTKTIVRCGENDTPDPEKGLAMAIAKKALGNTSKYYDTFKEHLPAVGEEAAEATHNPVETAYELLVAYRDRNIIPDMGTIEEIIGHLGEALA